MQIDELRGELTTLADEMERFEGDVHMLHRRERRRRVATTFVAVVLVVAGVSTAVFVRHGDAGRVQVSARGTKEVNSKLITRVDAVVVPANAAVAAILDASPLVARYTHLGRQPRTFGGAAPIDIRAAVCALTRVDGFAVQATTPGPGVGRDLSRVLAGRATTYALEFDADMELFFKIKAAQSQVDAVRNAIALDKDISSARFVTKEQAHAIFAKDFADQPALVQSTKRSDLPESLRITLRDNKSMDAVRQRYASLAGVDVVITNASTKLFDPTAWVRTTSPSACTEP